MAMDAERVSPEDEVDRVVHELGRILFEGHNVEETLGAVVHLAHRSIRGCDAASVTVVSGGRPKTTVSTRQLADVVDKHQYSADDGPCLEAMRQRRTVRVDAFDGARWRRFGPAALQSGVQSSLSLPLVVGDEVLGALNLYSMRPGAFDGSETAGEVFARQAAITLANATAFYRAAELAANLARALEHRDVIGQAKGILMATDNVSPEQAFGRLRAFSQRSHRKLHDVARDIVEGVWTPDGVKA
jgi:GAF domain-containing protein